MSEDDDYESLGENVSLKVAMFAGSVAGVMEHCCMYPMDLVKTRQQALACDKTTLQSIGIFRNARHIVKTEGFSRLFQVQIFEIFFFTQTVTGRVSRPWLLELARPTPSTSAATSSSSQPG